MRIIPPVQDIHTIKTFVALLVHRFKADVPCGCAFFSCPQCDVNDLYDKAKKLQAFAEDD
jgi:hypothetical protein